MARSGKTSGKRETGDVGGHSIRCWIARLLVFVVFCWNMACIISFLTEPNAVMGSYQLSGEVGRATIRGMGIAFLMWNATYPAVIVAPQRFRTLFIVVLAQQLIGLIGETWIMSGLTASMSVLSSSILRFVAFDAAGLVMMAIAFALSGGLARRNPE